MFLCPKADVLSSSQLPGEAGVLIHTGKMKKLRITEGEETSSAWQGRIVVEFLERFAERSGLAGTVICLSIHLSVSLLLPQHPSQPPSQCIPGERAPVRQSHRQSWEREISLYVHWQGEGGAAGSAQEPNSFLQKLGEGGVRQRERVVAGKVGRPRVPKGRDTTEQR